MRNCSFKLRCILQAFFQINFNDYLIRVINEIPKMLDSILPEGSMSQYSETLLNMINDLEADASFVSVELYKISCTRMQNLLTKLKATNN